MVHLSQSFQIKSKRRRAERCLKPAANGRYLMCKSLPYYFHLLNRSTFILLSAKGMLGLFMFPRNPPNSEMDYRVKTFYCRNCWLCFVFSFGHWWVHFLSSVPLFLTLATSFVLYNIQLSVQESHPSVSVAWFASFSASSSSRSRLTKRTLKGQGVKVMPTLPSRPGSLPCAAGLIS